MRSRFLWVLTTSTALLVTGCVGFDEGEKNNKNEINAGREELNLRLAATDESGGDLAGAEKAYLQVAKSGSTQSVMELAGFYTRHNQAQRAVEILDAAYKKSPGDMNLMRSLANALISAGNPERALTMLDSALAKHGEMAYMYNSRGVALDKLGRYDEAQASYRKAISLNPQDEVDFKTNLSMSYILSGHYNEAIKLLTPVAANKQQTTSGVRQNLALAYGLKGNMDMALKIGSKDLTIKEMNENIRFYSLITKNKGGAAAYAAGSNEPADLFPAIAQPPAPTPEETATDTTLPPPPPPMAAPVIPIVKKDPPPVTAATIATAPVIRPAPAEPIPLAPVRNLTRPVIVAPKIEAAAPAPVISTPVAKIIKPTIQRKTAPVEDTEVPADETPATPSAAVDTGSIPVPVLKPDKW